MIRLQRKNKLHLLVITTLLAASTDGSADLAAGYRALQSGNYEQAVSEWRPLAQAGDPRARAMLAFAYEHGYGVPRDLITATALYEQSARQGVAAVQHDLGSRYFQGHGVPKDFELAVSWWQRAAEQGIASAQFNLGLMLAKGLGVERDDAAAIGWLQAAATQNHALAQYALGVMYATGRGAIQDFEAASRHFKAAARQIPEANYNLGILAESGIASSGESKPSESWFQDAAAGGLRAAFDKLDLPYPELMEKPEETATPIEDSLAATIAVPPDEKPAAEIETGIENPASSDGILTRDWIMQQNPGHFTVQLATGVSEAAMIYFLERGNFEHERAYFRFLYRDEDRYTSVYGSFNSRENARQALNALAPELKTARPWIRRFREVQAMLQR